MAMPRMVFGASFWPRVRSSSRKRTAAPKGSNINVDTVPRRSMCGGSGMMSPVLLRCSAATATASDQRAWGSPLCSAHLEVFLQFAVEMLGPIVALRTVGHPELHEGVRAVRSALELALELLAGVGADKAHAVEAEGRLERDGHELRLQGGQRNGGAPSNVFVFSGEMNLMPSREASRGPIVSTWTRLP